MTLNFELSILLLWLEQSLTEINQCRFKKRLVKIRQVHWQPEKYSVFLHSYWNPWLWSKSLCLTKQSSSESRPLGMIRDHRTGGSIVSLILSGGQKDCFDSLNRILAIGIKTNKFCANKGRNVCVEAFKVVLNVLTQSLKQRSIACKACKTLFRWRLVWVQSRGDDPRFVGQHLAST